MLNFNQIERLTDALPEWGHMNILKKENEELLKSNMDLHLKLAKLTLACRDKDAALQQAGYAMTLSMPSLKKTMDRLVYVTAKNSVDVALAIKIEDATMPLSE